MRGLLATTCLLLSAPSPTVAAAAVHRDGDRSSSSSSSSSSSEAEPERHVMLWASHPCTTHWPWPDARCNATQLSTFIELLTPLRGVVDRVAVSGYYIADPANDSSASSDGGLVRLPNLPVVVAALQAAGFGVEPLVGNGPPLQYSPPSALPQQVGSSIDRFRPILRQPARRSALARACAREVNALNLTGLNFDLEFSDCGPDCSSTPHCGRTGSARCNTTTDGGALGALITETQHLLSSARGEEGGARLSVDAGQCPLTWGNIINQVRKTPFLLEFVKQSTHPNGMGWGRIFDWEH
jgi:hypothetical protein